MTAADELRRLLNERGVEWEDGGEGLTIIPAQDGVPRAWEVNTWPSGKDMGDCLWVQNRHPLTPAQAIAATLGDVPRLPYFWTADGALHIELTRLPESISVRLSDQRDREVGSTRTWQYTHGSGTCHMEYCDEWSGDELYPTEAYVCSACSYVTVDGKPNYCPNCGREAVDE